MTRCEDDETHIWFQEDANDDYVCCAKCNKGLTPDYINQIELELFKTKQRLNILENAFLNLGNKIKLEIDDVTEQLFEEVE